MSFARLSAILATLGALGFLYVVGTTVDVFTTTMGGTPGATPFLSTMIFRAAAIVLLGLGVAGATWRVDHPTGYTRLAFVGASVMFGFGLLLLVLGNTTLAIAFGKVATAAAVRADTFIADCSTALRPLQFGAGLLVVAAALLVLARFVCPKNTGIRSPVLTYFVRASSLLTLLLLLMGVSMGVFQTSNIESMRTTTPAVRPDVLASRLSGILMGDYVFALALAGFASICLLTAVTPRAKPVTQTTEGNDGSGDETPAGESEEEAGNGRDR